MGPGSSFPPVNCRRAPGAFPPPPAPCIPKARSAGRAWSRPILSSSDSSAPRLTTCCCNTTPPPSQQPLPPPPPPNSTTPPPPSSPPCPTKTTHSVSSGAAHTAARSPAQKAASCLSAKAAYSAPDTKWSGVSSSSSKSRYGTNRCTSPNMLREEASPKEASSPDAELWPGEEASGPGIEAGGAEAARAGAARSEAAATDAVGSEAGRTEAAARSGCAADGTVGSASTTVRERPSSVGGRVGARGGGAAAGGARRWGGLSPRMI
eukprot:scaffold9786_cov60-Isochrysis_galbana.AAC.1